MTLRQIVDHVVARGQFHKTVSHLHHLGDEAWPGKKLADVETAYIKVAAELLELPGSEILEGHHIFVDQQVFEDTQQIHVVIKYQEETSAMDFIDWNDLVDLEVKDNISVEITEVLAHVLYEITFWGMCRDSINQQRVDMEKASEDLDNLIPFTLEELDK